MKQRKGLTLAKLLIIIAVIAIFAAVPLGHVHDRKYHQERMQIIGERIRGTQALEIKPDYPEAHNNLGVIYRQKGMYDNAIVEFKEAIRLKPDFAIAYYNIARAYSQRSDKINAVESLKKAIDLDSGYINSAKTEEAFDNIRESIEFQELIGR